MAASGTEAHLRPNTSRISMLRGSAAAAAVKEIIEPFEAARKSFSESGGETSLMGNGGRSIFRSTLVLPSADAPDTYATVGLGMELKLPTPVALGEVVGPSCQSAP